MVYSSMFHQQPFEQRAAASQKILETYPDRVPVIVYPTPNAPAITKTKFLAPNDMEMARFINTIRKHIAMTSEQALFMFVGEPEGPGVLPQLTSTMGLLHQRHKQTDGFLYVRYALENTFG